MKTAVGGTFNVLHRGHRLLLDKAFEIGDEVDIGIMSDEYVAKRKVRGVPLTDRLAALEAYVSSKGKPYVLEPIDRPQGTLLTDPSIDALVVGPEAYSIAEKFSKERAAAGLSPLKIVKVGYALADDCTPISSTRVLDGEIDENGRLLRTMRVSVGSDNPVKVHAVFEHNGLLYDVQFCAVVDRMGRLTLGHGPGFLYPPLVSDRLRTGGTVGDAFHELYGQERTGRGQGAIGFLTHGLMTRSELTEQAVIAAMVPRIRKDLYFES
jgi:cytidyltransferase-like protein